MADGTQIDDRWLDLAGQRRRELQAAQARKDQLMRELDAIGKRITVTSDDLGRIKDAIAKGEPFIDPAAKPAAVATVLAT